MPVRRCRIARIRPGQIGAVPDTSTRSPTRNARLIPIRGSYGDPEKTWLRPAIAVHPKRLTSYILQSMFTVCRPTPHRNGLTGGERRLAAQRASGYSMRRWRSLPSTVTAPRPSMRSPLRRALRRGPYWNFDSKRAVFLALLRGARGPACPEPDGVTEHAPREMRPPRGQSRNQLVRRRAPALILLLQEHWSLAVRDESFANLRDAGAPCVSTSPKRLEARHRTTGVPLTVVAECAGDGHHRLGEEWLRSRSRIRTACLRTCSARSCRLYDGLVHRARPANELPAVET